jgi:serine/threonine-protein kinase RsbW
MTLVGQAEPLRGQETAMGPDIGAASSLERVSREPLLARLPRGTIERVLQASFPGLPESIRDARRQLAGALAGIPVYDDVALCLSEVATNAVVHSRSGRPGGEFAMTVDVLAGVLVFLAVADQGGPWIAREADTYPHGLEIARGLALTVLVEGDADGRIVHVIFPWACKEEA